MRKIFSKIVCLVLASVIVLAGCGRIYKNKTNVISSEPDFETISIPSGSEARVIEVTGGTDAWMKTKQLQLDCVVAFYQPDDSFYLTEQRYEVYPWSNSIEISAVEPKGGYVWKLSKGQFSVLEGTKRFDGFPVALEAGSLAELILNIVTAPIYFMDASVSFDQQTNPVQIQGQWYYPMNRISKSDKFMSVAYFYQNRDNSMVDVISFPRIDGVNSLVVRGYEYHAVEKNGIIIPSNIEIFVTDSEGEPTKRLARIDCRKIERIK